MEAKDIIQKITKKYHEIDWEYTSKSITRGHHYYISVDNLAELYTEHRKKFLLNKFANSAINYKSELKNYIVITQITSVSRLTGNQINIDKNGKENIINENISKDNHYFYVEQKIGGFTSHFFKVLNDGKEIPGYEEMILEKLLFPDLKSFQKVVTITEDNWDDYGYRRLLNLTIWGERFYLRVNPRTPEMINYLKNNDAEEPNVPYLCSLGDVSYYEFLKKYLSAKVRKQWFSRGGDLSYNIATLDKIARYYREHTDSEGEELEFSQPKGLPHNFFNNSFLRNTSLKEIKDIFHPLTVAGMFEKNQRESSEAPEIIKNSVADSVNSIQYSFSGGKLELVKKRESSTIIPTNVYALIGGNGSGKSYTINQIIKRHMEDDNNFSSIMHFSLSPFDNIIKYNNSNKIVKPIEKDDDGVKYENIGFASVKNPVAQEVLYQLRGQKLKDIAEWFEKYYKLNEGDNHFEKDVTMKDSFTWYIQNLLLDFIAKPDKEFKLWLECLDFFSFEQWAEDIQKAFEDKQIQLEDFEKLSELSSGQSTILLYLTKLVKDVSEGCLVIFDEPETFMHPPMIKSFIRAVSRICKKRKAFCLIATHSPIILQEIPHDCVYKLSADHKLEKVKHKTFGENLESLYKNIYGVELQRTGFMSELTKWKNKQIKKINNGFDSTENDTVNSDEIKDIHNLSDAEKSLLDDEAFLKDLNLSDVEESLLGDEAFLKYLIIKDEIGRYIRDIKEGDGL